MSSSPPAPHGPPNRTRSPFWWKATAASPRPRSSRKRNPDCVHDERREGPWTSHSRAKVRPGLSYPVQQGDVCGSAAQGERNRRFSRVLRSQERSASTNGGDRDRGPRMRLDGGGGDPLGLRRPSQQRAVIRSMLLADGLSRAAGWLAALPGRGNAWLASRHAWALALTDGSLVTEEQEGSHWRTMRRS